MFHFPVTNLPYLLLKNSAHYQKINKSDIGLLIYSQHRSKVVPKTHFCAGFAFREEKNLM